MKNLNIEDIVKYTKSLKILYVEDDINLSKEMQDVFNNFFEKIYIALDGEEALELYKKEKFDIVFSDIKMPKMDGIELSKQIKDINPSQEIVIISAYNDADRLFSLIKIGVSDFILKPIDFDQLLSVLYKVSKNIYYRKKDEEYIINKTRWAQIGEMIDMTAHQWLQYLHFLGIKTEMIKLENDMNVLTKEKINKYMDECNQEIETLGEVLNEFRTFLNKNEKEKILLKDIINSCIILMKDYLLKNQIDVSIQIDDIILDIYSNQFKQVILNILSNMVDVFNERNIENRKIKIYNKNYEIYIEDNAGGIKEEYLDKIFNNNFTTKNKGTGKGLFLAKQILQKIESDIFVENIKNGARFIIKVKNGN